MIKFWIIINTRYNVKFYKLYIESTAVLSNITDVESIQVILDERCGEIKNLKEDITKSEDERFGLNLDVCEIKAINK